MAGLSGDSIPPEFLLEAYAQGVFPMGGDNSEIHWFSPDPRGILPLEPRHWNHGIRAALRSQPWQIHIDRDFAAVMQACAARPATWISPAIFLSYQTLHKQGHAHSLEVWLDDQLVGGLYGIHLGAAFFGESMFSKVSGASKAALVALIDTLTNSGFLLLDTQWLTPHLAQFGGIAIPRTDYLARLQTALTLPLSFPDKFSFSSQK